MSAIREARNRAGITQSHLASIIGVTRVTISRWESGRWHPAIKKLGAIARALGVQAGALLDDLLATAQPAQPAQPEECPVCTTAMEPGERRGRAAWVCPECDTWMLAEPTGDAA